MKKLLMFTKQEGIYVASLRGFSQGSAEHPNSVTTKPTNMKSLFAALIAGLIPGSFSSAGEPVNKKCPMSGKDVDAAARTELTVNIGLCCARCQGKFEVDAEMKEDAVRKHAGSKESPANTKCPVSNKDVKKENTSAASMTVAFCCDMCKSEFDKDPKKHITKVK
jgi:endogenous inhibitor of DNA gyrase (YacG/DUF329 family)